MEYDIILIVEAAVLVQRVEFCACRNREALSVRKSSAMLPTKQPV